MLKSIAIALSLSACSISTQLPDTAPPGAVAPVAAVAPTVRGTEATPASRNSNGVARAPGPRPDSQPATCGPAQDHCLHPETWFCRDHENLANTCYLLDGGFYEWSAWDQKAPHNRSGFKDAHRTRAATVADLAPGMMVVAWAETDLALPTTTIQAQQSGVWVYVEIAEVDAQAKTVRVTTVPGFHPVDRFRVITETRAIE